MVDVLLNVLHSYQLWLDPLALAKKEEDRIDGAANQWLVKMLKSM